MPSQEALDNWATTVQDAIKKHDAEIARRTAEAAETGK